MEEKFPIHDSSESRYRTTMVRRTVLHLLRYPVKSSWEPEPPFWYKGVEDKTKKPWIRDANISEETCQINQIEEDRLKEVGLNQKEGYLREEISKGIIRKEAVEDLQKKSGCSSTWKPQSNVYKKIGIDSEIVTQREKGEVTNKNLHEIGCKHDAVTCESVCNICGCSIGKSLGSKFHKETGHTLQIKSKDTIGWSGEARKTFPKEEPRYLYSWGHERKAELLRVGYPFATEASHWLHNTVTSFNYVAGFRPARKRFPEKGLPTMVL